MRDRLIRFIPELHQIFFDDLDERFGPADEFFHLSALSERLQMGQEILETGQIFNCGLQAFFVHYAFLAN